jgi:hypothetical protein
MLSQNTSIPEWHGTCSLKLAGLMRGCIKHSVAFLNDSTKKEADMNKIIKNQVNLNSIADYFFLAPALIFILSLIFPATVMAVEIVTYEGTLQGASCVHYKKKCPEDDAHIALEHDFVLLLPDGEHYFLPNLNRAIKARYVGIPVRISGELENHEIWVDSLDVKKGNAYGNVWSWEKQQELYKDDGG